MPCIAPLTRLLLLLALFHAGGQLVAQEVQPGEQDDIETPGEATEDVAPELSVEILTPEEGASTIDAPQGEPASDETTGGATVTAFPEEDLLPVPADVAAVPESAERRDSGLASRVLAEGSGDRRPNLASRVRVHYAGWTSEGVQIENTYGRDEPPFLPVDDVIDGWREGLQLMVEGEKRRFWIPGELAFEGRATMPQGTVVFDIELLEIVDPPSTPDHLTAPPAHAEIHNKKGLASVVLQKGHDVLLPREESFVTVHYTGWTTDGTIIDSSVLRGTPTTFPLRNVIKGWREGLQFMVVGEKRRFWIPAKLAYKGDKTKPQGMLIFDIELLEIPRY